MAYDKLYFSIWKFVSIGVFLQNITFPENGRFGHKRHISMFISRIHHFRPKFNDSSQVERDVHHVEGLASI